MESEDRLRERPNGVVELVLVARGDCVDEKYGLERCDGLLTEETGDGSVDLLAETGNENWRVKVELMLLNAVSRCPIPGCGLGL